MSAVGLILLAAGASRRMGEPKQLLPFHGQTLLRRAATTALSSTCRPVLVVLGAHASRLLPELQGLDLAIVENSKWEQGMGASIRGGMTHLLSLSPPELDSVLLMLCDQPLLTAAHLDHLVEAHRNNVDSLIASEYGAVLGVPALFPRSLFPQLLYLESALGAKSLIQWHRTTTIALPFPEGAFDLDTPEDYVRLQQAHS